MEVLRHEHSEDLVQVLDGGEVERREVVVRCVPNAREGRRDYVEDVHVCKEKKGFN